MRGLLFSALAVLAASLFDVAPASAKWTCTGADYICGGSAKPYAKSYRKASKAGYSERRRAKTASKSRRGYKRTAKRRGYTVSSKRPARHARASARGHVTGGRSGQTGIASYYWQGQRVASGGRFNPNAMTAAHKSLPFGTRVRVTHLRSGRSVDVIINDRGPFVRGRVIDLSRAAAGVIGMRGAGLAPVRVDVIGRG